MPRVPEGITGRKDHILRSAWQVVLSPVQKWAEQKHANLHASFAALRSWGIGANFQHMRGGQTCNSA